MCIDCEGLQTYAGIYRGRGLEESRATPFLRLSRELPNWVHRFSQRVGQRPPKITPGELTALAEPIQHAPFCGPEFDQAESCVQTWKARVVAQLGNPGLDYQRDTVAVGAY